MAPRVPKAKLDETDPLGPKIDKSKVEKPKAERVVKAKIEKKVEKKTEKTEKVKAVTGDEAVELILDYLKTQNRPYSATEVSANLHGKVSHL
jgi:26S proteasome regulatory subunit (ATPase 3-interacting protein)